MPSVYSVCPPVVGYHIAWPGSILLQHSPAHPGVPSLSSKNTQLYVTNRTASEELILIRKCLKWDCEFTPAGKYYGNTGYSFANSITKFKQNRETFPQSLEMN